MIMAKQYRVYRATNPPMDGGRQYFDVSTIETAKYNVIVLNTRARKKDWVFARL
jgi:hypothetical protein